MLLIDEVLNDGHADQGYAENENKIKETRQVYYAEL